MSNLKQKYKEFGGKLIPNEWGEYKIGDLIRFEGGSQPPKAEFKSEYEDGYIRLIQIRDYKSDDYLTYIPEKLARKFCDETDIMIGRYGPPIFQILKGIKGAYNVALMKAIPDEDKVLKEYAYYYLQLDSLFTLIDKLSRRSSGQTGVDLDALNNFPMPLPSIEEQNQIIKVIKLAEDMVSKQEQLIEKKKEFKKGLMQRLLSGEVRFNKDNGESFPEWHKVKLGEYLIKHNEKSEFNNQYPVLTSSRKGIFLQSDYYAGNDVASDDTTGYNVVPRGYFTYRHMSDDLIFKFNINDIVDKGIVSTLYPVFTVKNMDSYFLRAKLNEGDEFKRFALAQKQGGSRTYMYFSKLESLQMNIPSLEEQEKISEVLKLADKEIELLEKELEALKLQKKGLMQRLLTGEVRVKV